MKKQEENIQKKCEESLRRLPKYKQKIVKRWIEKNGASGFDFKNRDIIIWNGGLFYIDKYKYLAHKIIGKKKNKDGFIEILFSKKKTISSEDYYANLWFEDLDETINYFKRMKKMLNKIGIKTDLRLKPSIKK